MNKFFVPVAVVFGSIWLVAMLRPADLIQFFAAVGGGGLIGLCLAEAFLCVWDSLRTASRRLGIFAKLRRKLALRRRSVDFYEMAKLSADNDNHRVIYDGFGNEIIVGTKNTAVIADRVSF